MSPVNMCQPVARHSDSVSHIILLLSCDWFTFFVVSMLPPTIVGREHYVLRLSTRLSVVH